MTDRLFLRGSADSSCVLCYLFRRTRGRQPLCNPSKCARLQIRSRAAHTRTAGSGGGAEFVKMRDDRRKAISDSIRIVPHFPKHGIMFQDITTLLLDPIAFQYSIDDFIEHFRDQQIDVIAGQPRSRKSVCTATASVEISYCQTGIASLHGCTGHMHPQSELLNCLHFNCCDSAMCSLVMWGACTSGSQGLRREVLSSALQWH